MYSDILRDYPYYTKAPSKDIGIVNINIRNIKGDNWAFQSKKEMLHYPYKTKLRDIGLWYINNQTVHGRKELPPVPVFKIFDEYYLMEGNHRFYLSNFLNRKTIRAICTEFDYKSFMDRHQLVYIKDAPYLKNIDTKELFDLVDRKGIWIK